MNLCIVNHRSTVCSKNQAAQSRPPAHQPVQPYFLPSDDRQCDLDFYAPGIGGDLCDSIP